VHAAVAGGVLAPRCILLGLVGLDARPCALHGGGGAAGLWRGDRDTHARSATASHTPHGEEVRLLLCVCRCTQERCCIQPAACMWVMQLRHPLSPCETRASAPHSPARPPCPWAAPCACAHYPRTRHAP
jgi:hypothetical protein